MRKRGGSYNLINFVRFCLLLINVIGTRIIVTPTVMIRATKPQTYVDAFLIAVELEDGERSGKALVSLGFIIGVAEGHGEWLGLGVLVRSTHVFRPDGFMLP